MICYSSDREPIQCPLVSGEYRNTRASPSIQAFRHTPALTDPRLWGGGRGSGPPDCVSAPLCNLVVRGETPGWLPDCLPVLTVDGEGTVWLLLFWVEGGDLTPSL